MGLANALMFNMLSRMRRLPTRRFAGTILLDVGARAPPCRRMVTSPELHDDYQAPTMFFLWPQYLWLLLALPLLPAVYAWLLRRRRPAVRYSNLGLVRAAAAGLPWRRHVPTALLLLACSALLLAAARPVARVPLPWTRSSIMLAMDVSLSMRVADVKPTRLAAAQDAAKLFLPELPPNIQVGLVTFAGRSAVRSLAAN